MNRPSLTIDANVNAAVDDLYQLIGFDHEQEIAVRLILARLVLDTVAQNVA